MHNCPMHNSFDHFDPGITFFGSNPTSKGPLIAAPCMLCPTTFFKNFIPGGVMVKKVTHMYMYTQTSM